MGPCRTASRRSGRLHTHHPPRRCPAACLMPSRVAQPAADKAQRASKRRRSRKRLRATHAPTLFCTSLHTPNRPSIPAMHHIGRGSFCWKQTLSMLSGIADQGWDCKAGRTGLQAAHGRDAGAVGAVCDDHDVAVGPQPECSLLSSAVALQQSLCFSPAWQSKSSLGVPSTFQAQSNPCSIVNCRWLLCCGRPASILSKTMQSVGSENCLGSSADVGRMHVSVRESIHWVT